MKLLDSILNISNNPFLSGAYLLLLIGLLIIALYLFRRPFHRIVEIFFRMIRNALRLSAVSVLIVEKKVAARNREVLMAEGLKSSERLIEREFERINRTVEDDMQSYPALHRRMSDTLTRLEDDYKESADIPPELPDWINMIEAIANIKHSNDTMISNMLGEINKTLRQQHKTAVESYRTASAKRHGLMSNILPLCRGLQKSLNRLGKSISDLNNRSKSVDQYMDDYQQIRKQTDMAERKLLSSCLTRFIVSGLSLIVALGIAIINFNLVSLPLSEIFGGASYIGSYRTYHVAGVLIVMLEIGLGVVFMESLRITRLFSIIGGMDDRKRFWFITITLTILTIMAFIGSALAFMQDRLVLSSTALNQILNGSEVVTQTTHKMTVIVQMVLGFIFPFILICVAVPLELFIVSARTVVGKMTVLGLRFFAFSLRLFGTVGIYLGKLINMIYDFIIYPTLWLEGVITGRPYKVKKTHLDKRIEKKDEKTQTEENMEKRMNPVELNRNPE